MTRKIALGLLCLRPYILHQVRAYRMTDGKREHSDDSLIIPCTEVQGYGQRRADGTKEWKEGRTHSRLRSTVQQGACQQHDIRSRSATVFWQQCNDVQIGAGNCQDRCRFWCHQRKRSQLDQQRQHRQRWRVTVTSDDDRWLVTGTLRQPVTSWVVASKTCSLFTVVKV